MESGAKALHPVGALLHNSHFIERLAHAAVAEFPEFRRRLACYLLKLPAEMRNAAVAEAKSDLRQGHLVIDQ